MGTGNPTPEQYDALLLYAEHMLITLQNMRDIISRVPERPELMAPGWDHDFTDPALVVECIRRGLDGTPIERASEVINASIAAQEGKESGR